jgi:hypothetical protein
MSKGADIRAYAEEPSTRPSSAECRRREQEDIQLALALSLTELEVKENRERQRKSYDVANLYSADTLASKPAKIMVKALYDFRGREDDELSFRAGQVIEVMEDGHPDWWRGFPQDEPNRVGLFPKSYAVEIPGGTCLSGATADGAPRTGAVSHTVATRGEGQETSHIEVEDFCRIMDRARLASTAYRYKQDAHLKVTRGIVRRADSSSVARNFTKSPKSNWKR